MKALILVDVQNDFMPGGALAVNEGDAIVPVINQEMLKDYDTIVATQDWHPQNHKSFASQHPDHLVFDTIDWQGIPQVLWPNHCIQGSEGANFHSDLDMRKVSVIFRKGMDIEVDSYSAFFDNQKQNDTGLHAYLQGKGITELTFCGLAGDYCVAYSVNDALDLGYQVQILEAGVRSIDDETYQQKKKEWNRKGVKFL